MDKIFDPEVEKYLLECGMSQEQINKVKYTKCKENAINLLKKVITLLQNSEYEEIVELTAYSPAGDDMGCDNDYINFGSCYGTTESDILSLCGYLRDLNIKKENK